MAVMYLGSLCPRSVGMCKGTPSGVRLLINCTVQQREQNVSSSPTGELIRKDQRLKNRQEKSVLL